MYLRSLTLRGFKSFARKTVLEFEPGVTIIVGPNGSGKSNIADAVLWALGEQSPTSLRGNRMEDIIFSGSSGHRPVGMAEVALTLDNASSDFPLDYSEVTISRNVIRGGDSEYRLNNSSCRLLDIQEMLSDAGVGRNLNAVISQGQLDDVLTCRPEERREYIEEAAGLLKYRRRREKAMRRLERMDEELVRIGDVLREVKRQLRPLVRQADRLEQYKFLNKELSDARLQLDVARLRAIQREWQGHEDVQHERGDRLAALEKDLSSRTGLMMELEGKEEDWRVRETELRDRLYRLVSVHEQLKALFPVWGERQRSTAAAPPVDPTLLKRVEDSNSELQRQADGLRDRLRALSGTDAKLGARAEEIDSGLNDLTLEVVRLEAQLEVAMLPGKVGRDVATWVRDREGLLVELEGERDRHELERMGLEEQRVSLRERASRLEETTRELRLRNVALLEGRLIAESRRSYLAAWCEILGHLGAGEWRAGETGSAPEICGLAREEVERSLEGCLQGLQSIDLDIESCLSEEVRAESELAALRLELENTVERLLQQAEVAANRQGRVEVIREELEYWSGEASGDGRQKIDTAKVQERLAELRGIEEKAKAEARETAGSRAGVLAEMKALETEIAGIDRELELGRKGELELRGRADWLDKPGGSTAESIDRFKALHESLIEAVQRERERVRRDLEEGSKSIDEAVGTIRKLRTEISLVQLQHDELREQMHSEDLSRAELKIKVEQLVERIVDGHKVPLEFALKQYHDQSPAPELEDKVEQLARRLEHIGPVNPEALTEREALEERYNFLREQVEDVESAKAQLRKVVREVDQQIVQRFTETAEEVDRRFKEIFSFLFPNGRAEIRLTEPDDLLNTGIEILAQPEGKRLRRISLLSGGETSLTAIAFFFALFKVRPSPFYFLDEVEAALDDVNLHRFLDLVREFKDDSQLILITHQKRSMEIADILYGVTMHDDGVSRVVSQRVAG